MTVGLILVRYNILDYLEEITRILAEDARVLHKARGYLKVDRIVTHPELFVEGGRLLVFLEKRYYFMFIYKVLLLVRLLLLLVVDEGLESGRRVQAHVVSSQLESAVVVETLLVVHLLFDTHLPLLEDRIFILITVEIYMIVFPGRRSRPHFHSTHRYNRTALGLFGVVTEGRRIDSIRRLLGGYKPFLVSSSCVHHICESVDRLVFFVRFLLVHFNLFNLHGGSNSNFK